MKGGVDEEVHVIQDEGAIDVDVDAASVALAVVAAIEQLAAAKGATAAQVTRSTPHLHRGTWPADRVLVFHRSSIRVS